jgi:hypothetical protein
VRIVFLPNPPIAISSFPIVWVKIQYTCDGEGPDLGTVQYLLKGRAGGKAKFHEKKLPALRSIK